MKNDEGVPFLPSTQGRMFRTLFAHLKKEGITQWAFKDLKNFPGNIHAVCAATFEEAMAINPDFGKKERIPFTDDDIGKIRLFVNSESFDRVKWLLHLVQVGFGVFMGFRGRKEHRQLRWCDVSFGSYPDNHHFSGRNYVEIKNKMISKNNQLTLGKSMCVLARSLPVFNLSHTFKKTLMLASTMMALCAILLIGPTHSTLVGVFWS